MVHEHALETKRWLYGVRLSFALSDWARLGARYPKALEAMRAIRDRDIARLLDGTADEHKFADVAAINEVLNESAATFALFRSLISKQPAQALKCWRIFRPTAIAAGEYALAREFVEDPDARFQEAKQRFQKLIEEQGRETALEFFSDDVCALVEVLAGSGADSQAAKFESAAIAFANDRRVEVAGKHARRTGNHRRAEASQGGQK